MSGRVSWLAVHVDRDITALDRLLDPLVGGAVAGEQDTRPLNLSAGIEAEGNAKCWMDYSDGRAD